MKTFLTLLGNLEKREEALHKVASFCHGRVLDVATGSGYLVRKINAKVICLDISQEIKKLGYPCVVADARKMPFKSNAFDVVATWSALVHIPGWKLVVKEMFRVAKELVITAEPNNKLATLAFRDFKCKHEISIEEIIKEFEKYGKCETEDKDFVTIIKGYKWK